MMLCWYCNKSKLIVDFYLSKIRKDNTGLCKQCQKIKRNKLLSREWQARWRIRHPDRAKAKDKRARYAYRYGLTEEAVDQMVENQKGLCEICQEQPKSGKQLCVDHNHITGKVRAMLCDRCNRFLGMFEKNKELFKKMDPYLKTFE